MRIKECIELIQRETRSLEDTLSMMSSEANMPHSEYRGPALAQLEKEKLHIASLAAKLEAATAELNATCGPPAPGPAEIAAAAVAAAAVAAATANASSPTSLGTNSGSFVPPPTPARSVETPPECLTPPISMVLCEDADAEAGLQRLRNLVEDVLEDSVWASAPEQEASNKASVLSASTASPTDGNSNMSVGLPISEAPDYPSTKPASTDTSDLENSQAGQASITPSPRASAGKSGRSSPARNPCGGDRQQQPSRARVSRAGSKRVADSCPGKPDPRKRSPSVCKQSRIACRGEVRSATVVVTPPRANRQGGSTPGFGGSGARSGSGSGRGSRAEAQPHDRPAQAPPGREAVSQEATDPPACVRAVPIGIARVTGMGPLAGGSAAGTPPPSVARHSTCSTSTPTTWVSGTTNNTTAASSALPSPTTTAAALSAALCVTSEVARCSSSPPTPTCPGKLPLPSNFATSRAATSKASPGSRSTTPVVPSRLPDRVVQHHASQTAAVPPAMVPMSPKPAADLGAAILHTPRTAAPTSGIGHPAVSPRGHSSLLPAGAAPCCPCSAATKHSNPHHQTTQVGGAAGAQSCGQRTMNTVPLVAGGAGTPVVPSPPHGGVLRLGTPGVANSPPMRCATPVRFSSWTAMGGGRQVSPHRTASPIPATAAAAVPAVTATAAVPLTPRQQQHLQQQRPAMSGSGSAPVASVPTASGATTTGAGAGSAGLLGTRGNVASAPTPSKVTPAPNGRSPSPPPLPNGGACWRPVLYCVHAAPAAHSSC